MAGLIRSLAPVADGASRVLILGSMPGPRSLSLGQYYAHPTNQFWRLMAAALRRPILAASGYPRRLAVLRDCGVALWDTMASCQREGSGDGEIREARPNDVPGLLAAHPGIHSVFLNGAAAARMFARCGVSGRVPRIMLPSSSAAHAGMPFAEKLNRWKAVGRSLREAGVPA